MSNVEELTAAAEILLAIAKHTNRHNPKNAYSVSIKTAIEDSKYKVYVKFQIKHENDNTREKKLGPFLSEAVALSIMKIELRKMIDEANLDIHSPNRRIMMYPGWLL